MKKFLSLVLAVIMTMSLVTISASAAEYKDFTDKDEIQYEEAVAVLNRLGIITGYSEGDFRPEGELTRGAAAKIIVSLLIGPEAANNVSPTTAPYKDVPLDHAFAGVIAYCKTAGIISGYKDGSFQPGGTLTGYAFSKMLLGALGYKSDVEHFTGSGWNMNVNARGSEAGLFDRLDFKGNDPVNREQAAQLALNTLKGTMVEYTGGINVTTSDGSTMTSPANRVYKTSNQEYATHILNRKATEKGSATSTDALYTVEFGEEHFVDLRMKTERSVIDEFGRPSNQWSYKKNVIGTYPITPDKTYTEQVAHNVPTVTNASKARSLELSGLDIDEARVFVNGAEMENAKDMKNLFGKEGFKDVGQIADLTDNGTVVEVYIDDNGEDEISNIVVIKTQLMEVKRLSKESVALDLYDNGSDNKGAVAIGFNQAAINMKVENVEIGEDYYEMLSGMKVGDLVAVVPVYDGGKYYVAEAYAPETISGALKKVSTYGTNKEVSTVGVTIGDTAYDVALWNKKLVDIDGDKLDVTRKDVTLTLDKYGNALLAEDVGATNDFMVVGSFYQSLVNNKLVTYVKGWDISGEELELNLGSNFSDHKDDHGNKIKEGDLVYYTNDTKSSADWKLDMSTTRGVFLVGDADDEKYEIKSSNSRIKTTVPFNGTDDNPWIDKGIKFIYVSFNDDGEVDSISIKNGVQGVKTPELAQYNKTKNGQPAQLALKLNKDKTPDKDSTVKAVVIKNEANDATASNMLYIVNYEGRADKTDNGDIVYQYTVAMNGANGLVDDDMTIYSTNKFSRGDWVRYTEVKNDDYENFYKLSLVDQRGRATSTMSAKFQAYGTSGYVVDNNKSLVYLNEDTLKAIDGQTLEKGKEINGKSYDLPKIKDEKNFGDLGNLGDGDLSASFLVSLRYATWVDLTNNGIDSYEDLADLVKDGTINLNRVRVSMIFNDDPTKDAFRQVAMIVVQDVKDTSTNGSGIGGGDVVAPGENESNKGLGETTVKNSTFDRTLVKIDTNGRPLVKIEVTDLPSYVPDGVEVTYKVEAWVDGVKVNNIAGVDGAGKITATKADNYTNTIVLQTSSFADEDSKVEVKISDVSYSEVKASAEAPANVKVTLSKMVPGGNTNTAKIEVPEGYEIKSVTVTQNGRTLTANRSGNAYTITDVTDVGEVKVTVTTESKVLDNPTNTDTGAPKGAASDKVKEIKDDDSVRDLEAGSYTFKESDTKTLRGLQGGALKIGATTDARDCMIFIYPRTGAANASYTLTIGDKNGVNYYTESFAPENGTKTNGIFNVQVNNNYSPDVHNYADNQQISADPLPAGNYTWTVKSSVTGTPTMATGTFTIDKLNEVTENPNDKVEVSFSSEDDATKISKVSEAIRAKDPGVYAIPDEMKDVMSGQYPWIGGKGSDNRAFVFTHSYTKEDATLSVYNDEGTLLYEETAQFDDATVGSKGFFFIQVTQSEAGAGCYNNADNDKTEHKVLSGGNKGLETGTYRYTVRSEDTGAVLVQGEMAITNKYNANAGAAE